MKQQHRVKLGLVRTVTEGPYGNPANDYDSMSTFFHGKVRHLTGVKPGIYQDGDIVTVRKVRNSRGKIECSSCEPPNYRLQANRPRCVTGAIFISCHRIANGLGLQ